jgi:hypothetical protein
VFRKGNTRLFIEEGVSSVRRVQRPPAVATLDGIWNPVLTFVARDQAIFFLFLRVGGFGDDDQNHIFSFLDILIPNKGPAFIF